ncbi:hypothetical protein COK34_06915 [Bacillus thuringiensis]|uniref:GmrSD restriction endonuclease domain-containing protein n=1 Tax=Bacillus thuringiensis TaxID=1428 RepID=UPI000BF384F1|nr:DUF262 domain-containing protein [Bacillus thuringiensis]PFD66885.1 hypothetical protein CN309_08435 [Bacillus thuringiensis]PFO46546.1 hypothetical protein COJ84_01400 [Bacillus thuringiensis]PFR56340.1 hypothetical protein COK34_06915 [Bacillus thuringiensis]
MAGIDSKKVNISNLLINEDFRYKIPDFQRTFVWGAAQARELMDDFSEDTHNFNKDPEELDGYLLGNIVVIEDEEENIRFVIDGQQRLTTLTLIFRIMYHKNLDLSQNPSYNNYTVILHGLTAKLLSGFSKLNTSGQVINNKLFHDESLNFGETYRYLLKDDPTTYTEENDETPSDKNIRIVYETLSEYIEQMSIEQHLKFARYLESKVSVILTKAPNLAKAFQLFEILNNRGVGLEPIDLIKNLFLKKLSEQGATDEQDNEFKNNWASFLDNLHFNKRNSINESQFLKHYIIGTKGKNIKNEEMYEEFTTKFFKNATVNEILDFSKDIKKRAETYTKIAFKSDNNYTDDINKLKYIVDVLGIKQLFFLLIPFYNESQDTREEVLDLALRLGSSVLFSFTQTNFIEREIPSIIEKYLNSIKKDKTSAYAQFVTDINQLIKEKAFDAKNAIATRKFEKGSKERPINKVDQIFKFIEYYGLNHERVLDKKINNKKISLEHIFSKKLDPNKYNNYDFKSENEFKEYLNRIGNLTLLLLDSNTSGLNKTPEEKAVHYEHSEFFVTKKLFDNIPFSVNSGERKDKIDFLNNKLSSYFKNNKRFNKKTVAQRSNEIAEIVYELLIN